MRQRDVPVGDTQGFGGGQYGAVELQRWPAGGVDAHNAVVPFHPRRRTECLGDSLLRRKPGGQGRIGTSRSVAMMNLNIGQHAFGESGSAFGNRAKALDFHDVDADTNDHMTIVGSPT